MGARTDPSRVLLLGATGLVGAAVADRLRAGGVELTTTTRQSADDPAYFDAEADDGGAFARLWAQLGPFDFVVNCIGARRDEIDDSVPATVRRAVLLNALLPHEIARQADGRARVIHVSTDAVFAPDAATCYESDPVSPTDSYGRSKSLGEVLSPWVITIRSSFVGQDARGGTGLLEWLARQRPGSVVPGYVDQAWNGVTTLQFAAICEQLIRGGLFDAVRQEAAVHHLCPNIPVTKYELLRLLRDAYGIPVEVGPARAPGGRVSRVLATRHRWLARLAGCDLPMDRAIERLAAAAPLRTSSRGYA